MKRSAGGLAGTLRRWKRRFVILSHSSAELQHYNPSRRNWKEHIRRIPFSKMLAVKKTDKKGFSLSVSSAYMDPSVLAKASSKFKVVATLIQRLTARQLQDADKAAAKVPFLINL